VAVNLSLAVVGFAGFDDADFTVGAEMAGWGFVFLTTI
jgi:hypothetical protein